MKNNEYIPKTLHPGGIRTHGLPTNARTPLPHRQGHLFYLKYFHKNNGDFNMKNFHKNIGDFNLK
jgi:hypothetical protein